MHLQPWQAMDGLWCTKWSCSLIHLDQSRAQDHCALLWSKWTSEQTGDQRLHVVVKRLSNISPRPEVLGPQFPSWVTESPRRMLCDDNSPVICFTCWCRCFNFNKFYRAGACKDDLQRVWSNHGFFSNHHLQHLHMYHSTVHKSCYLEMLFPHHF